MSDAFWCEGFGPLLPETDSVTFGDLDALHARLKTRRYAALVLKATQVEGGVRIPSSQYLRDAQALCRQNGTLLVLDEVQTGLYRTGPFLASHQFEPDMDVLAKALSGGLIPVRAVLMSDGIYDPLIPLLRKR